VHHLFQAMLGIWPLSPLGVGDLVVLKDRLGEYMVKAAREAKQRTSWTDPDEGFESALLADVEALLAPDRSPRFLDELERFVKVIARAGLWNALARVVLHLSSPGVPDLYQGDELWNFALVDPDNRRPVDFDMRRRLLEEIEAGMAGDDDVRRRFLSDMVAWPEDGRIKLHVVRAALAARAQRPAAFRSRRYLPLAARGPSAGKIVAFARGEGTERLVAAVPRLLGRHLASGGAPTDPALWTDTTLPLPDGWPARWTCALSGRTVRSATGAGVEAADLFGVVPAALLLAHTDP
jgi:(1->4)-alpha-D-glucan 1-alpha-D-glucosylmutase